MKKQILKTVISITLATSLLAGCGKTAEVENAQSGDTTITDEKTATTSSDNGEKTVIEYWHCNAETQGGLTVEELVSNFNEQNDHIEVVAKYNPDMYKGLMQNLQAETAAGNTPAIVQIGWAFLDYFNNNFAYTSPQDAIDRFDSKDATFLTDNFLPNILDLACTADGQQVGIPYSLSNPVLYVNTDLLEEAGISNTSPETWEEVFAMCAQIKEKTGKYGLYVQEPSDFWAQQAILESNGAKLLERHSDGSYEATFASEEGIEAMQTYADNVQFEAISVKSPVWEGKERKVCAGGCFLAITAQEDEQIKAAWEFEKYLYSVESMAAWTIGTGYVPPRKDVADAPNGLKDFLAENQMMTPAIEQMGEMVKWTAWPGDAGLSGEQIMLDARDQILGGEVTAAEGLKNAQEQINALLP